MLVSMESDYSRPGGYAGRHGAARWADLCLPRRMSALLNGMAERPQQADETGGFRPQGTGEGVGLVEHQVVQVGGGEQFNTLLPGEQQLQLLDVGEQNARLPAGRAHGLAGTDFLGRINRLADAGSLPMRCFVETSHAVAALTNRLFASSAIRLYPDADSRALSAIHQRNAWVSSNIRTGQHPSHSRSSSSGNGSKKLSGMTIFPFRTSG